MSMTMDMSIPAAPAPAAAAAASAPVLTGVVQSGITPDRSGCNTAETVLTSLEIQKNGVRVLWECDLPGDDRGTEHQPLVVSGVVLEDGLAHDCLYVATMSNDLFCFDAAAPDPTTGRGRLIWKQRIGNPVNVAQYDKNGTWNNPYDMYPINRPFWGTLSCPYIDLATQTLYAVSLSSPDATFPSGTYYLHARSLVDGSAKAAPVNLSTVVCQSPGGPIAHNASPRKQRAGLAFFSYGGTDDVIFIADSTFAMMGNVAHGFLIAVDVTGIRTGKAMTVATSWTATAPPYAGTGIWMAGQAPAIDEEGNLFIVGANGAFDPTKGCYGNAAVKLGYAPASGATPAKFSVLTWWAGYSDAGRDGYDPTVAWIGLVADYSGKTDGMDMTAKYDQDLGCSQGRYIPKSRSGFSINLFIACGKDGIAFGLNADAMGNTLIGDFAPDKIQANWGKCLFVTGATFYPGDFDITPTDLGTMSTTVDGYTHHQHSTPPDYLAWDHGMMVFFGGENGPVRAFNIVETTPGKFACNYLGTGIDFASPNEPAPGGMPGTFMSIACNGTVKDTAALHCLQPLGDGNKAIVPGKYIIYGANWIADGVLVKLWDSSEWGITYAHNKFGRPTPAFGKVFVPTYDARVLVFG